MFSFDVCEATCVEVAPVRFSPDRINNGVYATQRVTITDHRGNRIEITLHLKEGCTALTTGDVVTMPPRATLEQ